MKKLFVLSLALVAVAVTALAQPSEELDAYLRAFPQRLGLNSHSYEFLPIEDTPAPSGFKPFYISHYGRHGSRSDVGDKDFSRLQESLQAASDEGILTPSGDSLLYWAKKIYALHNGMPGRLTDRGAREHALLAERMYQRFARVFRRGEVRALSSTTPRCLVSMAAFTASLKACKADLQIHWDCGEAYQRYISRGYSNSLKERVSVITSGPEVSRPYDTLAIHARIFTDVDRGIELMGKKGRLASYIFTLARYAEAFDIDENLFRFLPWDMLVTRFCRSALSVYLGQCNSLAFGDERLPRAAELVGEMVRKADEAIEGAPVAADLIFGHDWPFLGLCAYFGLEGYGYPRLSMEEALHSWNGAKFCPFAANLQIIFYRNRKGDVIVKFLTNERETPIPELEAFSGPYYRWEDVKAFIGARAAE